MALFGAFTLLVWGLATIPRIIDVLGDVSPVWRPVLGGLGWLGIAAFTLFFYLFPDGRFVPGWTRWPALMLIAVFLPGSIWPGSRLDDATWPPAIEGLVLIVWMGSVMVVQIYHFRRVAGPIQRQQTKWVVFGVTGSALVFLGLVLGRLLVSPTFPREGGVLQHVVVNLGVRGSSILIPLAIGIAILRYRLWDIDPIINRALVYGTLTLALGLVYFGSVVVLQTLVRFFAGQGQESPLVVVSSTLTIAGLFQPLRRRIQATIDRRFYRRNYDAAQTLQAFSVTLRDEVDLNRLTANLLDVVEETMQPAHVSVWLRNVPSTARGRSAPDSPDLM
jgi:hypothetical protein